jgi:transglutaminase-like putative cysteine protease
MSWSDALNTTVNPIPLDAPKVFDLPKFDGYQDPKKLDVMSRLAEQAGRDPRLATIAVDIFRAAGVQPRDYRGQAAALLRWVQHNIYYVNEPDERLQEPTYTLRVKYGDCDDMAVLLYALCRSVRLPCKYVISGTDRRGRKVRYHQGDRHYPRGVAWAHVYCAIGDRPYGEPQWIYAEPTMKVALGWDVVGHNGPTIPEMGNYAGAASAGAAGAVVGAAAGNRWDWKEVGFTVVVGAMTAVASEVALGWFNEWRKTRKKKAGK